MTNAAIYTRISDDREGKSLGVERQESDCCALACRLGLRVVARYSDNDLSASTRARKVRPGYKRLLADAAAGDFAVVIAATSARITRKPREFEDLIELAESSGTRFEYDKSPRFDLNTADGRMMARMMAAADAAEAERISERVIRKLAERAAAGKPHGGHRPFGWEPDRMTIRESEAKWLRWAYERLFGGMSVRATVRELNELGVTNASGGAWTHATFRGVVLTARHAGLMTDGSRGAWPQIVTPEQYRALRRLFDGPARVTTPGRAGRLHLLSGLATAAPCGTKLRMGKSKDSPAYRCSCGRGCIVRHRDHLEGFVRDVIAARLRRKDAVRLLSDAGDEHAHAARLAAEVRAESLRQRLDEAADEHARAGLSVRQLAAYCAPLRVELAEAEEAATPPADRAAVFGDVLEAADRGAAFLASPLERQRAIIDLLVTIEIGKGVRGNTFNPAGVTIEWR